MAALGVALFAWWEFRAPHPMLDLRIFRLPGVSADSLVIVVESLATFGVFFLLLQFLQEILGYSAFRAGLGLLPLAVAVIIISPTAPKFGHRFSRPSSGWEWRSSARGSPTPPPRRPT